MSAGKEAGIPGMAWTASLPPLAAFSTIAIAAIGADPLDAPEQAQSHRFLRSRTLARR
jgi:hypothetical protein